MASTEPDLAPVVLAAAAGSLPAWACVTPKRREHIARVAALVEQWADALQLSRVDRARWCAAAWLHDALRDADPKHLRALLSPPFAQWPAPLLHGPAVAERLPQGVDDEVRDAVRFHTLGHRNLGRLGRALYLADFLEPGRNFAVEWRKELRARMPAEMGAVLVEVVAARIAHLIDERKPMRPETAAFWSVLVEREQ